VAALRGQVLVSSMLLLLILCGVRCACLFSARVYLASDLAGGSSDVVGESVKMDWHCAIMHAHG